jgi:methyl-accepting chemotaxis protein
MLSVLYSHRVAGPLYRIKIFLKSIADGKPDKALKLRHKDAIGSFAAAINEMTGAYRQKSLELISEIDQLKKSVNELEQLAGQGRPVDEILEKIIDTDKRMSGLLKTVKVNDT